MWFVRACPGHGTVAKLGRDGESLTTDPNVAGDAQTGRCPQLAGMLMVTVTGVTMPSEYVPELSE
jgi:hypothetical protein